MLTNTELTNLDIHIGLDSMSVEQIMTINLGRIDQYSDELFNHFVEYIEQHDRCTEIRMLTTISQLTRRERLIIARAFRKVYMNGGLYIRIQNPQMYCINKYSGELFSLYITMIESNTNTIKQMSDIIDKISTQDRSIMSITYSVCVLRGDYK